MDDVFGTHTVVNGERTLYAAASLVVGVLGAIAGWLTLFFPDGV